MGKASKLKAVEPKEATPSRPKITVFGKPGVGKTWAALDFPSVYYIDTEGGADLEHYIEKLKASGGVYFGPEQGSQDFENVIEQVKALATEDHFYKTLVIDSLSKIYNLEINKESEIMEKAGRDMTKTFSAEKKVAVRHSNTLIRWLGKLDMNILLICHELGEWSNGVQIGTKPDAHDKLEHELHLCLHITKQGESRIARAKKSRLKQVVDGSSFPWGYQEFVSKFGKELLEKKSSKIILATEEQIAEVKKLLEVVKLSDSTQDKWINDNQNNLAEVEAEKLDNIITHLKSKIKQ